MSVIATGAWKLTRAWWIERLDARAVAYAATHTVGELRRWMKRFIARVEPDELQQRDEDIIVERSVTIDHSIAPGHRRDGDDQGAILTE